MMQRSARVIVIRSEALILSLILCLLTTGIQAQTTDIVILSKTEMARLRVVIAENSLAKKLYDSIRENTIKHLNDPPHPLTKISYEGLLDTDPERIKTMEGLDDIDKVVNLIYSYYGNPDPSYARKASDIVLAWVNTYRPDGNTINENKLVPLFWASWLFQDQFSQTEKRKIHQWMLSIARRQIYRPKTPNNNWESKRQKIIGTAGCILDDDSLKQFSINGLKQYINTAYYADGTSNDLKQRDALLYHISGLTPIIAVFVNCSPFNAAFKLFDYESPSGASVRTSVAYTLPYARGTVKREEWVNSKAGLDKKRAEAGLEKYRPGKLFEPANAIPMFEWASYYHDEWFALLSQGSEKDPYTATWVGLLNSPLIRN